MGTFGQLWTRTKAFFAGLLRRKPPEPGRFESGTKGSFRGFLSTAPWILPRREYLVYVPQGHSNWRRAPLLVLIHGCRQKPEDIAAATRITELADRLGCLVLLPRQNPRANAWGCWNWFDPATARGRGETAIVAAQIHAVRRQYRIARKRMFVAGLSSGGGLAAALGMMRPDLIAGAFVHSGVACGAASSALAAFAVLAKGADTDIVGIATNARSEARPQTLPVPLVAFQGSSDTVVAPVNSVQLVRQYLALNGHPAAAQGAPGALPPHDRAESANTPEGRTVTTTEWLAGNRLVARHILVDGLGHAWSGGDDKYPYNDPHAPDATGLLGEFVREAGA
jgi:poly(hydroxyalkanoate) depolymerase family esterase